MVLVNLRYARELLQKELLPHIGRSFTDVLTDADPEIPSSMGKTPRRTRNIEGRKAYFIGYMTNRLLLGRALGSFL